MKANELNVLIKRVPSLSSQKLKKARENIARYVLEEVDSKKIIKRIDEVASSLYKVRNKNRKRCDSVWKYFAEFVFSLGKSRIFLDYYRHIAFDGHAAVNGFDANIAGRSGQNEGGKRMLAEFFKLIGESVDYSIEFCLLLAEIAHGSFEKNSDGRIPSFEDLFNDGMFAAYNFLLTSVSLPKRPELPMSFWFHNLLEHAERNEAAFEVVRFIFAALSDSGNKNIGIVNFQHLSLEDCLHFQEDQMLLFNNPIIAVSSPEEEALVTKLIYQKDQKGHGLYEKGQTFHVWFLENKKALEAETSRKRREILENPSRGLRANGADHIKINISTLYGSGIRAVSFFPEGCQFPDIGIRVLAKKWTPHLVAFKGSIKDLKLYVPEVALINRFFKDYESLEEMLECVIIDALYRIIVVQREMKSVGGSRKGDGRASVCEKERASEVRPHFRRLPEGRQASEEAKSRAESLQGWKLPSGKTFVRGHYRNGKINYDVETEPIIVYDDMFLKELV